MTLESKPSESVTWCEGGTPHTVTDPVSSKSDGYYEGTAPAHTDADVLPADHVNWWLRALSRWVRYLNDHSEAEVRYEEVADAIADGHAYPDRIVLYRPTQSWYRGAYDYKTQIGSVAVAITKVITDGYQVYSVSHGASYDTVYATKCGAGATSIWHYDLGGTARVAALACDGNFVYVGPDDGSGLKALDPSDGSVAETFPVGAETMDSPILIACNGGYLAAVDSTATDTIEVYQVSATPSWTRVSTGITIATAQVYALAMFGDVLYVYYKQTSAVEPHLAAYDMSTLTQLWDTNISSVCNTYAVAMACDGERLYTVTARSSGATVATTWAWDMVAGGLLWSYDTDGGGGASPESLSVNSREVVVGTDDHYAWMLDKVDGHALAKIATADGAVADEIAIYHYDDSDTTKLIRRWLGGASIEMQITYPGDPWRAPASHRAVPVQR